VNPVRDVESIIEYTGVISLNTEREIACKMNSKSICIILPALNEELAIASVIEEIPKSELEKLGYHTDILVVDGHSSDRTSQIAREKGARVLQEPKKGKGCAIITALKYTDADFVFMLDSDYTYPTVYIPQMLQILQKYPVVIGSRLKGKREKGALKRINLIGNHLLTRLANILYGTRISDLCTGYWGFRREVIKSLNLTADGFQIEAEILTQIAKKGYEIGELPILYRMRQGKPKLGSLKDGRKIAWFLIKQRFYN
jgi:dolichol-phosphate hexosyltransferase